MLTWESASLPVDIAKCHIMLSFHHKYGVGCFDEAVGSEHWNVAMNEEIIALEVSGTWELTPCPKEKKAIRCK